MDAFNKLVNLRTRLITRLICINLRSAGGGIRLRSYKVFTSFLGATFRKSWATISFFFVVIRERTGKATKGNPREAIP